MRVSHFASVASTVSVNTTPAVSHATDAAQALTRSRGVLQLLTARMNAVVSVHVHWFIQCVNKTPLCYSPLCWLFKLRPTE